jgi:2-methylisocitrate lyase-like PEP mutase family enzyme
VNVVRLPPTPSLAELAALGVARVSWRPFPLLDAIARLEERLALIQE